MTTPPRQGKDEMEDLIARLEKATGPDRELDFAIVLDRFPDAQLSYPEGWDEPIVYHAAPLVRSKDTLPHFTASLDAAMTLVPEGWRWQCGRYAIDETHCRAELAEIGDVGGFGVGIKTRAQAHGSTPAIALCIAALRARMQQP